METPSEHYIMVPNSILACPLSPSAKLVLGLVHSLGKKHGLKLTNRKIGERLGIGPRQVGNCIAELLAMKHPAIRAEYFASGRVLWPLQFTSTQVEESFQLTSQDTARPSKSKEDKPRETKISLAVPADPRVLEANDFRDYAFHSFAQNHGGRKPSWGKADWNNLYAFFRAQSDLTSGEAKRRWENYVKSTDPWISGKAMSLKFFLSVFDRFVDGPVGGANGSYNRAAVNVPTRAQRADAALREGFRRMAAGSGGLAGDVRPSLPEGSGQSVESGGCGDLHAGPARVKP